MSLAGFGVPALLLASDARADGIDIVALLTFVATSSDWSRSPALVAALVLGAMTINYLLNCVVIGRPVVRGGNASLRAVAMDLVFFTVIAQLADRVGAVAGAALGFLAVAPFAHGESGIAAGAVLGVILSFVVSGAAIALLVVLFARVRWRVPRDRIWKVAVAAGVLTNPLLLAPLFFMLRHG